jgi:hypothetical protein
MQILINHITRMQRGHICVAGLDLATQKHVRPVLPRARLSDQMLARYGGPFDIGFVVDLGRTRSVGHAPELEDHLPEVWLEVRRVRQLDGKSFFRMQQSVARPDLIQIFGRALIKRPHDRAAMELNAGAASLGCLLCQSTPSLRIVPRQDKPPQVRLSLIDPSLGELDLGVTDIRLYGPDHLTPDRVVIDKVSRRLASREPLILAVGIGRPFSPTTDPSAKPLHWLQVNNLHFADDPVWQLG